MCRTKMTCSINTSRLEALVQHDLKGQAILSCILTMYVTSADSQSIRILGTSFPERVPSHGSDLLYAQRENRLVIDSSSLPLSSVL
jgi:hypothetical protein